LLAVTLKVQVVALDTFVEQITVTVGEVDIEGIKTIAGLLLVHE
jgi:hypothetical protein